MSDFSEFQSRRRAAEPPGAPGIVIALRIVGSIAIAIGSAASLLMSDRNVEAAIFTAIGIAFTGLMLFAAAAALRWLQRIAWHVERIPANAATGEPNPSRADPLKSFQ